MQPRMNPATREFKWARMAPWNWPTTAWLAVFVLAYFCLALELSSLRWIELSTSDFDLGLFQQALWSSSHGRGFYASGEFTWDGSYSLLRIHPAGALFLLSPIYGWAPSPLTLFVIQSGVVAAAAVPLYLLARDVTHSSAGALAVSGLYLAWAPLLAANLFDFHLESFLPLEFLSLAWIWQRGSYVPGLVIAAASFATFEAAPAFDFLLGAFFLFNSVRGGGREPWHSLSRILQTIKSGPRRLWTMGVTPALILMIAAAVAQFALLEWQATFPSAYPLASSLAPGVSTVLQGPPQLPLSFAYLEQDFFLRIAYWLVLFALTGFLPLLAPRTFILSGPWIVAVLLGPPRFTSFGTQYAFVIAGPIFVGVAYGLGVLFTWRAVGSLHTDVLPSRPGLFGAIHRRASTVSRLHFALAGLLALNLLLSPVNPLTHYGGSGNGYNFSYRVPPGYQGVKRLIGLLPTGSQVLASDNLFPLVADDLNSYALPYSPCLPSLLPFNTSRPPDYLLLSENQLGNVPGWITGLLAVPGDYGLRGSATETPAGIVLLYERHYAGNYIEFAPGTAGSRMFSWPQLTLGPAGTTTVDPSSASGLVIESVPNQTGNIWYGPYVGLPAGAYAVSLTLRLAVHNATTPSVEKQSALEVSISGYAQATQIEFTLTEGELSSDSWLTLAFPAYFPYPTPRVEVRGYQLCTNVTVELDTVTIAATP